MVFSPYIRYELRETEVFLNKNKDHLRGKCEQGTNILKCVNKTKWGGSLYLSVILLAIFDWHFMIIAFFTVQQDLACSILTGLALGSTLLGYLS